MGIDDSKIEVIKSNLTSNILTLNSASKEILRFEQNGDIYLHNKLIENDKQVVDGFREFLKSQNLY